jgi:hypothetical protein
LECGQLSERATVNITLGTYAADIPQAEATARINAWLR